MEQTLAEESYDYIRKKLAGGDLPRGKRRVNRVRADEIGVSVIPLREAIHRRATEGLSWFSDLCAAIVAGIAWCEALIPCDL